MGENKAAETRRFSEGWIPHALVAVVTVIILAVLLLVQPWSGSVRDIISSVHSYRMTVTAIFPDKEGSVEASYEMVYTAPDRSYIKSVVGSASQEMIVVGEDVYTNEPPIMGGIAGEKISLSVASSLPSKEQTQKLLDELVNVEKLADEYIDGVACHHYRGSIDEERQIEEFRASLDPEKPGYDELLEKYEHEINMMRMIKRETELWSGKNDGIIRQIKYTAKVPMDDSGHWQTSTTLVNYTDFNSSIVIEPPIDASGELLPGWYLVGGPATEANFFVVVDADITDLKYRQTGIHIIVYNSGDVAVDNVRIAIKKPGDCRDSDPGCWISAIPAVIIIDNNVRMSPGDSMVFVAEYKYDEADLETRELIEKAKVRITYIMNGQESTRIYAGGSPYPEAIPP